MMDVRNSMIDGLLLLSASGGGGGQTDKFAWMEDYAALDYVQNYNGDYIDTDYYPGSATKMKSKWQWVTNNRGLFGAFTSGSYTNKSWGCNGTSTLYDNYNADVNTGKGGVLANYPFTYDKTGPVTTITSPEFTWTKTHNDVEFTATSTLWLFRPHGINHTSTARLFFMEIWDNDILVRSYRPVLRLSDGVAGVYDTVEGKFCVSDNPSSTHDFQYGGDIPSRYMRVAWISSDGSARINTGQHGVSDTLRVEVDFKYSGTMAGRAVYGTYVASVIDSTRLVTGGDNKVHVYTNGVAPVQDTDLPAAEGMWHEMDVTKTSCTLDDRVIPLTTASDLPMSTGVPIYLFNTSDRHAATESTVYIHMFRVYDDGVMVRDMVPCIDKVDGTPGMYDLCGSICPLTGTPFYVNCDAGSSFGWKTASYTPVEPPAPAPLPEVPEDYMTVDALARMQAVDTGLLTDLSDEWIIRAAYTGTTNTGLMGGSYSKTDSYMGIWLNGSSNLVEFIFGDGGSNSYKVTTTAYNVHQMHEYKMKLSTGEAWVDGTFIGTASNVSSLPHPVNLIVGGTWRGSAVNSTFSGVIAYCKITRGATVVRELKAVCTQNQTLAVQQGFLDDVAYKSGTGTLFYPVSGGVAVADNDITWKVRVAASDLTYRFKVTTFNLGGTVDWGDGTTETFAANTTNLNVTHTYATAGDYDIHAVADMSANFKLTPDANGDTDANAAKVIGLSSYGPDIMQASFADYAINLDFDASVISHLKRLGKYAFRWNYALTLDALPDAVTYLPERVFLKCTSLTSMTFPSNLKEIGLFAFASCSSLVVPKLPETVRRITNSAFERCSSLGLTKLPDSLVELKNGAFSLGTLLRLTGLPESLTTIGSGSNVFYDATGVDVRKLPDGVTVLETSAFEHAKDVSVIVFPAGMTTLGYRGMYNTAYAAVFLGKPTSIDTALFTNSMLRIYVPWSEGEVAGAPWGANSNAVITYNYRP